MLRPGVSEGEVQQGRKALMVREFMIAIDDCRLWDACAVVNLRPETRAGLISILPFVGGQRVIVDYASFCCMLATSCNRATSSRTASNPC